MNSILFHGIPIDHSEADIARFRSQHPPEVPEDSEMVLGEAFFDPSCRLIHVNNRWWIALAETIHIVAETDEALRCDPLFLFKCTQKARTEKRLEYFFKLCGFHNYHPPRWSLGVLTDGQAERSQSSKSTEKRQYAAAGHD